MYVFIKTQDLILIPSNQIKTINILSYGKVSNFFRYFTSKFVKIQGVKLRNLKKEVVLLNPPFSFF